MIAGLGVDIVEIERMRDAIARRPSFKERVFTDQERWYCEHKSSPETHYALRFAAKEAVLKALGTGFSGMRFTDVEVVNDKSGKPVAVLTGAAKNRADELGVLEMHLSLSYTHTTAVASAVAITQEARPRKDEKPNPREEISRSFKELRAMLDDLEAEAETLLTGSGQPHGAPAIDGAPELVEEVAEQAGEEL